MQEFEKRFMALAFWMRSYLVALKYNLPNTDEIYSRLLKESDYFEDLMYDLGLSNPAIFEAYLIEFIVDFRNLAIAEMSNNSQQRNKHFEDLLQITNKISEYFYNLNPQSDLDQWHQLFHAYVQFLYSEIQLIFSDDYKGDIDIFDKIISQSFLLADYIATTLFSRMPFKTKAGRENRICPS